jgi:hypothetical protein
VFFGENGVPELRYQIDAYSPAWKYGLEVEAGRGWMGNAIYRDLVQAMVMVQVDHLVLAARTSIDIRAVGGRRAARITATRVRLLTLCIHIPA